jgi:menaquinone-dependent protoporphyrinogen IX oxidase
MNKIAVIYQSHYGTTKKYAQWIAEELGAELVERKQASVSVFNQYDMVIYGGGLYAGGILGVDLVAKDKFKHLVVFTVGLADPSMTDYTEIMAKGFPNKAFQPDKVFHFRGGIDYKRLNLTHRGLMALLKKTIEKKSEVEMSTEGKAILETYGKAINFTDKEMINPLITYIKDMMQ